MTDLAKGSIYWANLNPTVGSEIAKTRPAVIVSRTANNTFADTVTVVPITSSTDKIYPFEVFLPQGEGNLSNDSKAKANHIRTIDKKRLTALIGTLSAKKLLEIEQAILIHLDIE
jgi:mRNA interferase MazF